MLAPATAVRDVSERPFPARLLRQLHAHVYNLVNEPGQDRESVSVQDLDARDPSGLRVVFGVGRLDAGSLAKLALRGVRRDDIAHHVLGTALRPLPPTGVLAEVLPAFVKGTPYVPVWKYLRAVGRVADDGTVDRADLDPRVAALIDRGRETLQPGEYVSKRRLRDLPRARTPADLGVAALRELMDWVVFLAPADHTAEDLREALVRARPGLPRDNGTALHEAVCLYDLLRCGPAGHGDEDWRVG